MYYLPELLLPGEGYKGRLGFWYSFCFSIKKQIHLNEYKYQSYIYEHIDMTITCEYIHGLSYEEKSYPFTDTQIHKHV